MSNNLLQAPNFKLITTLMYVCMNTTKIDGMIYYGTITCTVLQSIQKLMIVNLLIAKVGKTHRFTIKRYLQLKNHPMVRT